MWWTGVEVSRRTRSIGPAHRIRVAAAIAVALGVAHGHEPRAAIAQSSPSETIVLEAARDRWTSRNFGAAPRPDADRERAGDPHLFVGYHGDDLGQSYAYVDFDLRGLPKGRHLRSAHLELFALRSDGGPAAVPMMPFEARAIRDAWEEQAPKLPASIAREPSGISPWVHPLPRTWVRFDVTSEVRHRLAGGASYGWRLVSAVPFHLWTLQLGSRESEFPPRLVLVFEDRADLPTIYLPYASAVPQASEVDPYEPTLWPWSESMDLQPDPSDPLALELEVERGVLAPWQRQRFEIRLRNRGTEPITVIRPVEYSSLRMRMPLYQWELRRDGRVVRYSELPGCGTSEELGPEHFVSLAPGEALALDDASELNAWMPRKLWSAPGDYSLQLHYWVDKTAGEPASRLEAEWARVRAVRVASARVPFKVAVPPDRFGRRYPALRLVRPGWHALEVESTAGPADEIRPLGGRQQEWVYDLEPPGQPEGAVPRPRITVTFDAANRVRDIRQVP